MFFGWVFFLISLGSPHVRPMGRTCGEPNEIELTPIGVKLNGSRRVPLMNGAVDLAASTTVPYGMTPNRPAMVATRDTCPLHGPSLDCPAV